MKTATLSEAQRRLPELIVVARKEAIGLTDESGNLIGLLAGVSEENVDELLTRTPGFMTMIERSRASLLSAHPISAADLLAEAVAEKQEGTAG